MKLRKTMKSACLLIALALFSSPAFAVKNTQHGIFAADSYNSVMLFARGGNGNGNGGNGGNGPGDGTGNGPGDGTGNGPGDGTGNGPGTGECSAETA